MCFSWSSSFPEPKSKSLGHDPRSHPLMLSTCSHRPAETRRLKGLPGSVRCRRSDLQLPVFRGRPVELEIGGQEVEALGAGSVGSRLEPLVEVVRRDGLV